MHAWLLYVVLESDKLIDGLHTCKFSYIFAAIISGSNIDEIYDTVRDVIFDQSGSVVWLSVGKWDSF